jgi:hypothetical protein
VRDNLRGVGKVVGFALIMVALAAGVFWVLSQFASDETELQRQAAEITALEAGLDEANSRLEAEGEQPVPVPSVDSEGTVNLVPVPPTSEQTSAAVADWFAARDLSLTPGYSEAMQDAVARYLTRNPPPAGKDGSGPTDQQIADAAAAYLIANPPADGVDGSNGADGRGVVSAVLDGCDVVFTYTNGDTDRVGPICGNDGADGTNGSDGRGISDITCHTTGDWIITLTDGTALTVKGPCRAIQPEPTPTPSASTTKGR